MQGFTWTLRVTAGEPGENRVSARRHQFVAGPPVDFDVEYGRVTALEYALGALGAEIVGGLRAFAKRRRLELANVEAVVVGELDNPLTYLEVVGEQGHPGLTRVGIKVYVSSPHDEQTIRQLWDETLPRLPLVKTIGAAAALDLRLSVVP